MTIASGSYAYTAYSKNQKNIEIEQKYRVAQKAVNALYNSNHTAPKDHLSKDWYKKVTNLIQEVDNKQKRSELLKKVNGISKMNSAKKNVGKFIQNGVLLTSEKTNSSNIATVHDKALLEATKSVKQIKQISPSLYNELKKEVDKGREQVNLIKSLSNQLNEKKNTANIKDYNELVKKIREVLNKDDRKILQQLAENIKKNIDQKEAHKQKTVSSPEKENQTMNQKTNSYQNTNPNIGSNSKGYSSSNGESTSNANKGYANNSESSSKSGQRNQGQSNQNNQSRQSNMPKVSKPNTNNKTNDVNDIINQINNGNYNKGDSGEIDQGGNTWDEYEIGGH